MKKILSIALTMCMMFSMMAVNASAAYMSDANKFTANTASNSDTAGVAAGENAKNGDTVGTAQIPVYIQTEIEQEVINVYAISYDVTELEFTFTGVETLIWNPELLKYESKTLEGTWDNTQDIVVTNYSDIAVKVTPTVKDITDTQVTVTASAALELASAFSGDDYAAEGTATHGTIQVTLAGSPTEKHESRFQLATVTLTVTDNR